MKDPRKLHDLIVDRLSLAEIMVDYGVHFQFNPLLAQEVQFKCPFHGKDNKPSARLYNNTKTCFCWVCRKSWDVVSFVAEKEKFKYIQALKYLINRFKIDTSSIPDTPQIELKEQSVEYEDKKVYFHKIKNNLIGIRGKVPFEKYRALCAAYFMVKYQDSLGLDVLLSLKRIEDKICQNQPLIV